LGSAVLKLPPPVSRIASRGFCFKTPKPSTAPGALLRPTSPWRVAVGLQTGRAGLRSFGAGLRVLGARLRQSSAISVKGARRRSARLRRKCAISVSWSRLRGSRSGPRSICARLRSFVAGFRGSGAGPRGWRCVPEKKNRFLKAFQKPFKKWASNAHFERFRVQVAPGAFSGLGLCVAHGWAARSLDQASSLRSQAPRF